MVVNYIDDNKLESLVKETLEELCIKYPFNDHQSTMRASFEIFANHILFKNTNIFNSMMNRLNEKKAIKNYFNILEKYHD